MNQLPINVVEQMDRGLAYGEACFETFRVIDGAIFRWPEHLARLQCGLAGFGIALSDADGAALRARAVEAASAQGRDALVRVTVSGGAAAWGLQRETANIPALFIQTLPHTPRTGGTTLQSVIWPFALNSKPAKFTADYAERLRAMRLWESDGLSHAPLITCGEKILSGLTANVLILREGCWQTPAIGCGGILPGIVRSALLERGAVREADCPLAWLVDCEAMALCNSGRFIVPVAAINGRALSMAADAFAPLWNTLLGEAGVPEVLA